MKIVIAFVFLLLTAKCYSQQVAYKDLIGKWKGVDTLVATANFNFIDETNFILEFGNISTKYSYQLDTTSNATAFYFVVGVVNHKQNAKILIKLKSDTLKMQTTDNLKLSEWQLPETNLNTNVFVKTN